MDETIHSSLVELMKFVGVDPNKIKKLTKISLTVQQKDSKQGRDPSTVSSANVKLDQAKSEPYLLD